MEGGTTIGTYSKEAAVEPNPDHILGQLAVKNGLISASDLAAAIEVQAVRARRGDTRGLGQILLELGKLTPTQLAQLETGQHYASARHEAERLGELAIKNGLATLHQVQDALAAQRQAFQGGRGKVLRIGELLVKMGALRPDDVERLLAAQKRARTAPSAKPHPVSAPAPPPSPLRIEHDPPRPPRRPVWVAPVAAAVVIVAVVGVLLWHRAKSRTDEQTRVVREMETSMERGRSALSRGEVTEALEAYEKASAQAREAVSAAERRKEDATAAEAALWEADAKIDLLRASARWLKQVQEAVQAARLSADSAQPETGLSAVERALAVIADFQKAAPKDDPNRPLASRWLSELTASRERLAARAAAAKGLARTDAHYQDAKAAMDRVAERASDPPGRDASTDPLLEAIHDAASACEEFVLEAPSDDSRRPEIGRWQRRLEDLQAAREAELATPGRPRKTPGQATSAQELAKSTASSVVYICVGRRGGAEVSWGSGFIVDERGYVITNRHVVAGAGSIRVGWDDSARLSPLDATLVAWSADQDLALLKLPPGEYPALEMASDDPSLGQNVVVIGFPIVGDMREHPTLTVNPGIVSSVGREIDTLRDLLETNAVLTPGNSGGPIFELDGGAVLGIAVAAFQGPLHGRNLGIPVSWVRSEFPGLETTRGYEAAIPPPADGFGQRRTTAPEPELVEDPALKKIRERAKRDLGVFTKNFDQGKIWPASKGWRAGGKIVEIGDVQIESAIDAWKIGLDAIGRGDVDMGIELLGVAGNWYRQGKEMRDALLVESTYVRLKVLRACFSATSKAEALAAVRACRDHVVSLLKELSDLKHATADPDKRWSSTPQALKDVEDQLNTTKRLCTDLGVP